MYRVRDSEQPCQISFSATQAIKQADICTRAGYRQTMVQTTVLPVANRHPCPTQLLCKIRIKSNEHVTLFLKEGFRNIDIQYPCRS
jgi:hypothetical protein